MNDLTVFFMRLPSDSFWWIALKVFIAVAVITAVAVTVNFLLKYLVKHTRKSNTDWDDVIISSAHRPVTLLIWILGILYIAGASEINLQLLSPERLEVLRKLGTTICLLWFALRFLKSAESVMAQSVKKLDTNLDEFGVQAIVKILRISAIVTALLIGFQSMGFSVSGLLAFGGVGGIVVGFAAKDMLANFFGGLMIYLDRPFTEGDWIRSPDREIEGTVEHVGWRQTRIRTFERRPIYVPNSVFAQIVVENPSRMENRRFKESIGIRYDDLAKVSSIVDQIKEMMRTHDRVDSDKLLIVGLEKFDASSVNILVYTYACATNGAEFYDLKQDILLAIADIIERNGAEIAYPTQLVYLNESESHD